MEQTRISSSSPHASAEARATRGGAAKAPGQEGLPDAGAPGAGFALLLAALGDVEHLIAQPMAGEEEAPAGDTLAVLPQPDPEDEAAEPSAMAAWLATQHPGATLAERVAALAQDNRGTVAREPVAASGRESLADRSSSLNAVAWTRPGLDTLVGETAKLDSMLESAADNGAEMLSLTGTTVPARRGAARTVAASAQDLGVAGGNAVGKTQARAGAHPAEALSVPGAMPAATPTPATAGSVQPHPAEGRDLSELLAAPASVSEALPVAAAGALSAGTGQGQAAAQGRGTDGALTGAAALETSGAPTLEGDASFTDAAQAAAEELLGDQATEQMAYWVHQKTQNAELTLDRDGRPVEVKVSLTGDEAHVTFRSDHADAREALDSGSEQLREMLQGEGLHLAGVSVGTTGGGQGRDGGEREAPRGARQATVPASASAPSEGGRGSVGQRALDIFV